jgi:hypothetical protein
MPRPSKRTERITTDSSEESSDSGEVDSFLDSEDDFVTENIKDKKKAKKIIKASRTKPKKPKQKWLPLGSDRRVSVSSFKGETYVSIRQCFLSHDGEYLPTKNGISLTAPQWKKLLRAAPEIGKMLKAI